MGQPKMKKPFLSRGARFMILALCLALSLTALPCGLWAQETDSNGPDPENIQKMLVLLSEQVVRLQNQLIELQKLPSTPSTNKKKEQLIIQIDGLNRNFESLATQLNADDIFSDEKKKSDWSQKLEALVLPLLEAMNELTAKPRKIESLKNQISTLEETLKNYEEASQHVNQLLKTARETPSEEPEYKQFLNRLESLKSKYNPELVRLRLEESKRALAGELEETEPFIDTATRSIKTFFKYRGLNLLITLGIFIAIWYILIKLRVYVVGEKSFLNFEPWIQKVLLTAYSIFVLFLCIVSSLISLYLLNDWLLLSIIILFLVAVAWASRQFIPQLFEEVRLALNLGTVKENERLIWKGVPWHVKTIGLQAVLVNDCLEGGSIHLPVRMLINENSRPIVENEPWFPTRVGDWVLLQDGTYGQVQRQTMEQVVLRLKGNTEKFYTIEDFLEQTPRNISQGFRYDMLFGLDYEVQDRICDEIPKIFADGLEKHLSHHFQDGSPDFTHLEVTFDNAGASSLNLKIVVHVEGRCADLYEEIFREIQTTLVRICNENGLRIPFTQLTVNLADDIKHWAGSSPDTNPKPPPSV